MFFHVTLVAFILGAVVILFVTLLFFILPLVVRWSKLSTDIKRILRNKNLVRQTHARTLAVFYDAHMNDNEDVESVLFHKPPGESFFLETRERRVRTEWTVISLVCYAIGALLILVVRL